MRIRATLVTAAVALGAVAVSTPAFAAPAASASDVTFSNVKVNKGAAIVVGTTKVSVPVTYTVTHPASLAAADFATLPVIYRGTSVTKPTDMLIPDDDSVCKAASATVLNCSVALPLRTSGDDALFNGEEGAWKAGGVAADVNDKIKWQGDLGTVKLLRAAKLSTATTSAKTAKKNATLTLKSTLTRANWDTHKFPAYGAQSVQLQYKKSGAKTWTTLKTVKTSSAGVASTTAKATASGYYRYNFTGNSGTSSVASAAVYVTVR